MVIFTHIKEQLDKAAIPYQIMHHPPTYTSEQSAEYRGEPLSVGAKAIVYKIEKAFYLFVMPADRKIETKKVKQYFKDQGKRAKKSRFATADELMELTGLVPGSVPPFGNPILPFTLFVDQSILENEKVAFNAGSLTDSIIMNRADYLNIAAATIFDFTTI